MEVKSPHVRFDITTDGWQQCGELLEKLPILIRGAELARAIKAGGRIVVRRAKQLAPKPGYPGDKTRKDASLTPLRDTIAAVFRNYQGGLVMGIVMGPQYAPKGGGNHGHLVEHGHRIGKPKTGTLSLLANSKKKTPGKSKYGRGTGQQIGNVPPHPFMGPAWEDTKDKFEPAIINSLVRSIQRAGG